MGVFSEPEQKVMTAIAKHGPIKQIQSRNFVSHIQLTSAGVGRIVKRLENEAVVYCEPEGYVLADPLLKCHILRYRM